MSDGPVQTRVPRQPATARRTRSTFAPELGGEPEKAQPAPKTAVIVIHGMGEQRPMDTLRGFVDAAWRFDSDLIEEWADEGEVYSKPERVTGSFELRRITTRRWRPQPPERSGKRVDFFEFYWAHLMLDNSFGAVAAWLFGLLFRWPWNVPRRLLGGWLLGVVLSLAALVLGILTVIRPELRAFGLTWPGWVWPVVAALGGAFSAIWLRPVAGDAARYLSATPSNVAARQGIREAGIDLLTKLQRTGEYDRIIVAGHSLGSVIGYDVLNYAWGRLDHEALVAAHRRTPGLRKLLRELEEAAGRVVDDPRTPGALPAYRDAQRAYAAALRTAKDATGAPLWLVTDFVTLGSPLSSADVLLAADQRDLEARIKRREQLTSPPRSESGVEIRFSYVPAGGVAIPHHAAVFAPVVWTNLYFPHVLGVIGDYISGPIAPLLGVGVRDVRLPIGRPGFRHLSYWSRPERGGPTIQALRRALNLREHRELDLWQDAAEDNPVMASSLRALAQPEAR